MVSLPLDLQSKVRLQFLRLSIALNLRSFDLSVLDRTSSDGPVIDSPSLIEIDGVYILFFGSGCKTSTSYKTMYATATNVQGPYTRNETPLLQTGTPFSQLVAPGGADVGPGGSNIAFNSDLGSDSDTRQMWAGRLTISGAEVTIA